MTEFKVGDLVASQHGTIGTIVRVQTLYDVRLHNAVVVSGYHASTLRRVTPKEELDNIEIQLQEASNVVKELNDKKNRLTDQLAAKSQS